LEGCKRSKSLVFWRTVAAKPPQFARKKKLLGRLASPNPTDLIRPVKKR
jgi:hypothetical protein